MFTRRDLFKSGMTLAGAAFIRPLLAQRSNDVVLEDGQAITVFNQFPASADVLWKRHDKSRFRLVQPTFTLRPRFRTRPNAGATKAGTETYENWSGGVVYAPTGLSVQSVQGEWTIPDARATVLEKLQYCANWVGIDGDGSPDVCQAGVMCEAWAVSATAAVCDLSFWHEWYPADAVSVGGLYMVQGDLISVVVATPSGVGSVTAEITFLNVTTGYAASYAITAPKGTALVGNSAEWIAETPEVDGVLGTMPSYGQFFFTNCSALMSDGQTVMTPGQGNNINLVQNGVQLSSGTLLLEPTIVECQYTGPAA